MWQKNLHKKAQEKRLSAVIRLAGARYTPKLNVGVSIASVFDGLGRTAKFYEMLKSPANEIIKNLRSLKEEEINKVALREFETVKEASTRVARLLLKIPNSGVARIDFKAISAACSKANEAISKCLHILQEVEESERKQKEQESQVNKARNDRRIEFPEWERFRNDKYYLYKLENELSSLVDFSKSNIAVVSNNPHILLNGIAGSGKTHFLCDLSRHRIKSGLPTFIFLGEEFSNDKGPWNTVRALLGCDVANHKFVEALNRYAVAKRTRVIIIVDAVNERQIPGIHWDHFNRIKKYKNIGVVLSVRSGFEQSEIPASVLKSYAKVEHEGFSSHEWEALTKFFAEYKLPLPEIPILFPEFRIPLFLKIFCESFAGAKKPIKGHYGFTYIFEQYVKKQGVAVLNTMGETSNAGESKKRIWDGIIKELALYMGENGNDRVPEKQARSIAARQFPSRSKIVLGLLEKYWLVTKVPRYKKYKIVGFDYRFPYQKFSDHLIARNLLEKHLDLAHPEKSFEKGTRLGDILNKLWDRGLIEALSIQVPERLRGRELVYVAPRKFRYEEIAKDCFLESLVWRDLSLKNGKTKYINQRWVLNFLNKYIMPLHGGLEKILETIITISAVPDHPLNADLLHSYLSKRKLPDRDSFWLPFINHRYGDEGAVNRLLVWAWDERNKTSIQDRSLRLAGITLTWFLASSDRFLRDRSTKALVSMLTDRLGVLLNILDDFKDVADPYIQERLYAVAYGCILRSKDNKESISKLALYTYSTIFKTGKPPTHILLRDYARGVIEIALRRDPTIRNRIDIAKIQPPYGSLFPDRVPSLEILRKRCYPKKRLRNSGEGGDFGAIWNSLMHNNEGGISDFGNYVVNSSLNHWCNLRLFKDGSRRKTAKEIEAEFSASLNRQQKKEWKELENMRQNLGWQMTLLDLPRPKESQLPESKFSKKDLLEMRKLISRLERIFVKYLSKKQKELYRKGVLPRRESPMGRDNLNYAEIQRLILQRIIRLGWKPELFAQYDSRVREMGRDSHKSERIGKKYQWIAFHEILGMVADNFVFRGDWGDDFRPYNGPWQLWERDIDPSCLLSKTPIDPSDGKPWWIRQVYRKWKPSLGHTNWTRIRDDLPDQKRLIEVKARGGWLMLDGYVRWEQPTAPGEEKFSGMRRDVWYIIRGYIIKRKDASRIMAWAKKQNFMGRWMPDPLEMHNLFLMEYPSTLAYRGEYDLQGKKRWIQIEDKGRKPTGFRVLRTTEEYHWEGSGFDCSLDEGLLIHLPAKELVKGLNLKQAREAGKFFNKNDEVVAQDPSVAENGPGALLVRKKALLEYLKRNKCEILWTIIGEKLLIGGFAGGPNFPGRLEMGGAFKMGANGKLVGKTYSNILRPQNG